MKHVTNVNIMEMVTIMKGLIKYSPLLLDSFSLMFYTHVD